MKCKFLKSDASFVSWCVYIVGFLCLSHVLFLSSVWFYEVIPLVYFDYKESVMLLSLAVYMKMTGNIV